MLPVRTRRTTPHVLRRRPTGRGAAHPVGPPNGRRLPRSFARLRAAVTAAAVVVLLVGCASTTTLGPPKPTPADITGIAADLQREGVAISDLVAGDAGCTDPDMIASAIAFHARGLDQPEPLAVRIYIFRDAESYQAQRSAVDACAAAWISDPDRFEVIDASPFVLVGEGHWPAEFKAAMRAGLTTAAGDGG